MIITFFFIYRLSLFLIDDHYAQTIDDAGGLGSDRDRTTAHASRSRRWNVMSVFEGRATGGGHSQESADATCSINALDFGTFYAVGAHETLSSAVTLFIDDGCRPNGGRVHGPSSISDIRRALRAHRMSA